MKVTQNEQSIPSKLNVNEGFRAEAVCVSMCVYVRTSYVTLKDFYSRVIKMAEKHGLIERRKDQAVSWI